MAGARGAAAADLPGRPAFFEALVDGKLDEGEGDLSCHLPRPMPCTVSFSPSAYAAAYVFGSLCLWQPMSLAAYVFASLCLCQPMSLAAYSYS